MPAHTEPPIWVAIGSDGTISAHDTLDGAENALRDDDGDVWIECVTLQRDTHAPQRPVARSHTDETHTDAAQSIPTRETGTHRRTWLAPPVLTIPATWDGNYDGPSVA